MKNIDYTGLRRLAKYDIGTLPIGSGYLRNADQTLTGYFTQNATPVTNAFVPQAISNATSTGLTVASNFADMYLTAARNAVRSTADAVSKATAVSMPTVNIARTGGAELIKDAAGNVRINPGLTVTSNLGQEAAKEGTKKGASSLLGTAANTASVALSALLAVQGISGLALNIKDSDTLTAGDLSNMSSRSTEYTNGVAYERMGGYDSSGVNAYVNAQNKANKINGISSGLAAGAGIGGIIGTFLPGGPFTGLIGAGIGGVLGALGGGLFGGHARRKRNQAIEAAKRNYAETAEAFNRQNESEAASTGLRNEYYATHADEGLGLNEGPINALTLGGEPLVKVKYDKGGNPRVTAAGMFAITPETPERNDNIKIHASNNLGIIGNLTDPYTGERLAVETRPFVKMFNSNNPTEKAIGEQGLLAGLDLLDKLKKELKMMKADCGKGLRKYALGKDLNLSGIEIPAMAWLSNKLAYKAKEKEIDRMPVKAYNAHSPNKYLMQAGALMPTQYNIDPLMLALNDEARFANYAINLSAYSPGQKMAMLSNLYNKRMQNVTKLLGEKANQENTMRANYARWLSDVGAQEQQLISAYRQKYYDYLAQANAKKFDTKMSLFKGDIQNNNDMSQNAWNVVFGNKNIGLYHKDLTIKEKELAETIANNAINRQIKNNTTTAGSGKSGPGLFNYSTIWSPTGIPTLNFNRALNSKFNKYWG